MKEKLTGSTNFQTHLKVPRCLWSGARLFEKVLLIRNWTSQNIFCQSENSGKHLVWDCAYLLSDKNLKRVASKIHFCTLRRAKFIFVHLSVQNSNLYTLSEQNWFLYNKASKTHFCILKRVKFNFDKTLV